MAQRGEIKPGSLSDRVLVLVEAGDGTPVARASIAQQVSAAERRWLHRAFDCLVKNGRVRETGGGFVPAHLIAAAVPETVPGETMPEGVRRTLAEIVMRAHEYRRAGLPGSAVALLRRASARVRLRHVAEDLAALSDLFEHAPGFYISQGSFADCIAELRA